MRCKIQRLRCHAHYFQIHVGLRVSDEGPEFHLQSYCFAVRSSSSNITKLAHRAQIDRQTLSGLAAQVRITHSFIFFGPQLLEIQVAAIWLLDIPVTCSSTRLNLAIHMTCVSIRLSLGAVPKSSTRNLKDVKSKSFASGTPGKDTSIAYVYIYIYVHMYIYIYMYIHTYICTYIHTYIHTYMQYYMYTCMYIYIYI